MRAVSVLLLQWANAQDEADHFREEAELARCQREVLEHSLEAARSEICSLKAELREKEALIDDFERLKGQGTSTIAGLQNSNREAQIRVAQLEAEFR